MTPAQERALEELWPDYGVGENDSLEPSELFRRPGATYVEVGFGNGDALVHMAARDPDANFLGIEVHRPGVGSALRKIHQSGLANVRILCADAAEVFARRIVPASLAGVRIYFPDPWPKKRHHKRRLISPGFVAALHRALAPGGMLHLATDWEPYAEWMLEVIEAHGGWRNRSGNGHYAARPEWRPETRFERRGRRRGHPVRDLMFEKSDAAGPGGSLDATP